MCFFVGVGRNALLWFQPSASGKEIVLRPLPRPLPVCSIRWRALPQMRQNGPDRFRVGDIWLVPMTSPREWRFKPTLRLLVAMLGALALNAATVIGFLVPAMTSGWRLFS